MSEAADKLRSVDLAELTDEEILDHLDRVSSDVKRRNSLLPAGEHPALTVIEALRTAYGAKPPGSPAGSGNKSGG